MPADVPKPQPGPTLLRTLRQRAGLSQERLAEIASVHVRTVRGLETGHVVHPRRTTIALLAQALGLDVGAHLGLLAAWNLYEPVSPTQMRAPSGVARIDVIEAFLTETRNSMHALTLTELVVIGPDRRISRRSTSEVIVGQVDGITRRCLFYDPDDESVDITRFHLTELINCSVVKELVDPSGRAKLFELSLDRALSTGHTQVLHYSVDFHAARVPTLAAAASHQEEIAGFVHGPASYLLEVRFHDDAVPQRCSQVFQARPTGPIQYMSELALTPANSVHIALLAPKPGGHGIGWRW